MASSRRQYPFHLIEPKWQEHWERHQLFRAWNPGEAIPPSHPFARRHKIGTRDETPHPGPPPEAEREKRPPHPNPNPGPLPQGEEGEALRPPPHVGPVPQGGEGEKLPPKYYI